MQSAEPVESTKRSVWRNVIINLLLICASLGVAYCLSEWILAKREESFLKSINIDPHLPTHDVGVNCGDLTDPSRLERFAWDKNGDSVAQIHSKNPILAYELRPSSKINSFISTNADGFRDREFSKEKPDGVFRIVVLGDSITFGWLLKGPEVYTSVLETLLNQEGGSKKYEVYNLAVDGYNAEQELELLKTKGFSYKPDLVLVGYCCNDNQVGADAGLWRHFTRGRSRTLDFIKLEMMRRKEGYTGDVMLHRSYVALQKECKQRNAELVTVIFPHTNPQWYDVQLQVDFCKKQGIRYVDLREAFKKEGMEQLLPDQVHPTARGHQIAAEQILAYLKANELVQSPDSR